MRLFRYIGSLAAFLAIGLITVGTASGMTALQKAVNKGDIKKVQELLDKGADVNEWNFGTALIWAASKNRLEIAKLLIDRGSEVNSLGKNGWTALGCAAGEGYGDMIDLLISRGADIDQAIAGMKIMAEWVGSASAKAAAKIVQGMGLIHSRAGMAFYSSGQYEKAASVFQSRVRANPRDPENFIGLAFSNVALKKYDEAKAAAESAILLAPDRPNAYVGLADSLTGKGDFAKAVEPLKKSIGLNPKNPWVYNRLGNVFFSLGNYPEAVVNYQAAAELAPDESDPVRSLMNTWARMGELDKAIAAADKLLGKMEPKDSVQVLGFRSFLCRENGRADEAASSAEKAGSIDPGHDWSLFSSGVVALDRGSYDEAVRQLSSIKDNGFTLARVLAAIAYAKRGDVTEAERIFATIGGPMLSSTNLLFVKNAGILADLLKPAVQGHLEKANSLEAGGDPRGAIGENRLALQIADQAGSKAIMSRAAALLTAHPELAALPEEARKYSMRGEVLVKEKDLEGALGEYTSALRAAPFCPSLRYDAALLAAELGKFSQAIMHMNAFLELSPAAPNAREAKDLIYKWEFMIERSADKR
ncbi:MAG: tetratricopeptide repeat protein [Candidatus Aminicenantes bacterium]|nr:tetratricopeptide repeat protein [Candidatus Aminicenantes bacterium]